MPLDNTTKETILNSLTAQFEAQRYSNEVMGQAWNSIGNVEMAAKCAEGVAENVKILTELQKRREALVAPK